MDVPHDELEKVLSESQRAVLEIVQKNTIPIRPEGFGFTYREYAESTGSFCRETARIKLNGLVEQGLLERKSVVSGGHKGAVYYKPGTWPE